MTRAIIEKARKLRGSATEAEKILWDCVRSRRFLGIKFRRQSPIGNYVADFVSFEKRMIIELYGEHHHIDQQREEDAERQNWLEGQGYIVIRFWNDEVLYNIEGVLQRIEEECKRKSSP